MAEKDVAKDAATEENTVAKDIVVTKYKMAADIVNGRMLIQLFQGGYSYVTGDVLFSWFRVTSACMPRRVVGRSRRISPVPGFQLNTLKTIQIHRNVPYCIHS